jgi:hypothetical protein
LKSLAHLLSHTKEDYHVSFDASNISGQEGPLTPFFDFLQA